MKVAELEVLLTSNADKAMDEADSAVKAGAKKIEANKPKIDADVKPALEGMERVEQSAKKIVSAKTIAVIDADIEKGQAQVEKISGRLEELQARALGGLDVTADVKRAESQLAKVQRSLAGLVDARSKIDVVADTSQAESALDGLENSARDAGADAGEDAGSALGDNIVAALVSIPIAGAVVGIGAAAAKALIGEFNKGLQIEVGYDRLQALSGLDEPTAQRLGNAAGEAFANNFGESVEANMDATRLALQFDILDETSTTRDAQLVIQSLSGIADVLGEDVQPIARATSQAIRTGLVGSASEFFDVLATGAREGINAGDDLLDTFIEYSTHFRDLGLSGEEALGLLNQGLEGGAFNADKVADALKEMTIQLKPAADGSIAASDALNKLGFDAEDMSQKFVNGGPEARDALEQILTKLGDVEDGSERTAISLGLFGTQAEDMSQALSSLDLTSAVDQLNGVDGAAQRMFDTLSGNDASKIEQAQRNIEVAVQGIQGALAQAFSEPLGDFADWVSRNRGPLMQFLLDIANGALDFGDSIVEAMASGVEGAGTFVSSLSDVVYSLAAIPAALGDQELSDSLVDMSNDMKGFGESAELTADGIRENLGGAIDIARDKLNDVADPLVALGFVNDAAMRTAEAVSQVGYAADGTKLSVDGLSVSNLDATGTGRLLQEQLDTASASLEGQYESALLAGESQANLTDRYNTTRDALYEQLTAMGLSEDQAQSLIDTVLKTPDKAVTVYSSNADAEKGMVDRLTEKIVQLPDGNFIIVADDSPAQRAVDDFLARNATKRVNIAIGPGGTGGLVQGQGGIVEFMAMGGLTPMAPVAQTVPANTWRIVGDRGDVSEAYIPLDGSARSIGILLDAIDRMPNFKGMAGGGVTGRSVQPSLSLEGMRIEGRLQIDGDGFGTLIDARVRANGEKVARDIRSRRRSI